MSSIFIRTVLVSVALTISVKAVSVQPTLTDIRLFSADANGTYDGPDLWDTRPGGNFDTWISSGTSFLNGPSDAAARPNILLPLGTNSFGLYNDPGAPYAYFGINLFFNGSTTPSISALTPMMTTNGPHTFSVLDATSTPGISGITDILPSADTLSFTSGNERVTLTDFFLAQPSVFKQDRVGRTSIGTDCNPDYVGGITFTVTSITAPQVPEPGKSLWIAGLVIVSVTVHRKARSFSR